jgi:hypothetical protein
MVAAFVSVVLATPVVVFTRFLILTAFTDSSVP